MSWRPPEKKAARRAQRDYEVGADMDNMADMDDGGEPEMGRYSQTALGDLSVAQARWWNSYLDMILKLGILFLFITMSVFSVAFWVPLMFNTIVHAIYLFVFPFGFAAFSVVMLALSVVDAFTVGLHYRGVDALGRQMIVSYRDRTFNLLLSGISLAINLLVGALWAVWYGRHNDLDSLSDYAMFSQGVATYYVLCGVGGAVYLAIPVAGLIATYANVRYEMGVHLLDNVLRITRGEKLEDVFARGENA